MNYRDHYRQSITRPEQFWGDRAQEISWYRPPTTLLGKDENGIDRWFIDGELNSCYLAVDHHIEQGRGEQTALIYDSPVTGIKARYSFHQLRDRVAQVAGFLQDLGVGYGDRVVIYMPMVPEAVIAMLATARLGAIHSVVFGGFAPRELALRIDDAKPRVLLSASCGIEIDRIIPYKPLLDEALHLSHHQPCHCVILQRPQQPATLLPGRDHDWATLESTAQFAEPVPVRAIDPLYILYTSGTTGRPKGVVRDNGGHAVALKYSMRAIYDVGLGDTFWAASDVGWVVGHSYIVYGPLFAGCTTVLYEGKPVRTPDAGAFWRVIAEHQVRAFFTAPTAMRAIKKEDPEGKLLAQHDIGCLKQVFLAGERLDPPTYHWLRTLLPVPVIDHWWQTETGWAIAGNPTGIEAQPTKPGSATLPMPGFDIRIVDAKGEPLPAGQNGNVLIKQPLPPSCLPTLWGDHQRFVDAYLAPFPGYYLSGDGGYFDEDGYLFIMGRTDDVINVAGHRLSTGEMEEVIAAHPDVAECAVMAVKDELKGQLPFALVVMKDGADIDSDTLEQALIASIRQQIGPIACFQRALVVKRLPKTRSGKILRNVLRQIADHEPYQMPATIDDPSVLEEISQAMTQKPDSKI